MTASVSSSPSAAAGRADRYRTRLVVVAAVCVVAGLLSFSIDLTVARWSRQGGAPLPGDVMKFLNIAEGFAHTLGVAALIATLVVSDSALALPLPGRPLGPRGNLVRLVSAAYAGGLVVMPLKSLIPRVRPNSIDPFAVKSVLATFGSDALAEPLHNVSQLMSFPSGHAATAAGLAAALGWKYPRGRPAFAAFVVVAALQRVVTAAHYPSDICIGAAIGLAAAAAVVGGRPPWGASVAGER